MMALKRAVRTTLVSFGGALVREAHAVSIHQTFQKVAIWLRSRRGHVSAYSLPIRQGERRPVRFKIVPLDVVSVIQRRSDT